LTEHDGFEFELETDSLANSMGKAIPHRSLCMVCGAEGKGKSLMGQRLAFGLIANGAKVAMVTTELTTRGWIEQVASLGYWMEKPIQEGQLLLLSRFGVLAEENPEPIDLMTLLDSEGPRAADFVIVDRASSMMGDGSPTQIISTIRRFCADGRTLMLMVDEAEIDDLLLRELRGSAEILLDMLTSSEGGFSRSIGVTRFLRAAGPVQPRIGWRVEPGMGFIVDITAVS
jgi:flagellar protein FlaH